MEGSVEGGEVDGGNGIKVSCFLFICEGKSFLFATKVSSFLFLKKR